MQYRKPIFADFIDRPNRFIAHVELNGSVESVHVKNTGRLRELLIPGAAVLLEEVGNPARKTKYDLIAVYKPGTGWVNIDSQAPNKLAGEWLKRNGFEEIKPEYGYGSSRIDFYAEKDSKRCLIEVKGCTLEINGTGYFPDAPTERGIKHLRELMKAVEEGYRAILAFVIPMNGVVTVLPNRSTHPEFGRALDEAEKAGVEILYLPCASDEYGVECL